MEANNSRMTVILNGRQDLPKVLMNLKKVFEGDGKVLLMTKSGETESRDAIKLVLAVDDGWVGEHVVYHRFNEVSYEKASFEWKNVKVFCIKIPNSLYRSIPTGYNDALKFARKTGISRFVHFFADDCRIVSDSYDPSAYEWFMDTFDEPFVMDSKLNHGNYAFRKYSPRFVFMSKMHLPRPVSFVQYEAKDHFVVDLSKVGESFDEKLKRLYMPEFVHRLHGLGLVRHMSFYPDPVLEKWVERDSELPQFPDVEAMAREYSEDERYLKEGLGMKMAFENAVNPIIDEMAKVISEKLEGGGSTSDEETPRIVIPKTVMEPLSGADRTEESR